MRRVLASLLSFFFPGSGHALIGRPGRGGVWLLIFAVVGVLSAYTFWLFAMFFVLRVGVALDVWRVARRSSVISQATFRVAFVGLWAASFASLLTIRHTVIESYRSSSSGMTPTLLLGDHIMTNKLSKKPRRGDVVVFAYPCEPDKDFVQRVVAVGGDLVEMRCNELYINGEQRSRRRLDEACTYVDLDVLHDEWIERECVLYEESIGGRTHRLIHEPGRDGDALVAFARQYAELDDGWCSSIQRPEGLKGKTISRIPALLPHRKERP